MLPFLVRCIQGDYHFDGGSLRGLNGIVFVLCELAIERIGHFY